MQHPLVGDLTGSSPPSSFLEGHSKPDFSRRCLDFMGGRHGRRAAVPAVGHSKGNDYSTEFLFIVFMID